MEICVEQVAASCTYAGPYRKLFQGDVAGVYIPHIASI